MKSMLFHNARIIDPKRNVDEQGELLVRNGLVERMGQNLKEELGSDLSETKRVNCHGKVLCPGLIDLRATSGEPGFEHKETLSSLSEAAIAGGVTSLLVTPNTSPEIDDPALIDFIFRRAHFTAKARIYPMGAMTKALKGEEMAELGLMRDVGAKLFSNAETGIEDTGLLKRIMQYAAGLDVMLSIRAKTDSLDKGVMQAGSFATALGLSGRGSDGELIALMRDITLAHETGCNLLIDQVSTAAGLHFILQARNEGQIIPFTVSINHLYFNELDVGDYLTFCKTDPPFRREEDRSALILALKAGEIDAIVSAHNPQPPEEKRLPFANASYGAAGIETLLSGLTTLAANENLSLLDILRPVTSGPADLMGLSQGSLTEGAPADIVIFDPNEPWACQREDLHSKSTNSPFDGRKLTGRNLASFIDGNCVFSRGCMTQELS